MLPIGATRMLYRSPFPFSHVPADAPRRPAEPLDGPPSWEEAMWEVGIAVAALLLMAVAAAGFWT